MQLSVNPDTSQFTDAERSAILEQLERMLTHSLFSQSRRYPALLRFVVHTTLEGHADLLKERTLGVEVFNKRAQYDTGNDPIVRVTAAELRKRITLYYGEPGHESELRLSLTAGSYVPRFEAAPPPQEAIVEPPQRYSRPDPGPTSARAFESTEEAQRHILESTPPPRRKSLSWRLWVPGIIVLLAVLLGSYSLYKAHTPSALQAFWSPVLTTSAPVLFCVGDQTGYTDIQLRDAAQPSHQSLLKDNLTAVMIENIAPIADIAGVLRQNGKSYTVRGEGATMMNDLRSGPSVFIGAYDNAWTLRLLKSQRFHFANDPGMTRFWIVDSGSKQPTPWLVDRKQQLATNIYRDYAIVARFVDSDTGEPAVVAAGIGRGGTIAAGEFLTTASLLDQVAPQLRSSSKNMELVLSTQIIGGEPGTPRVEAMYTW